MKVVHLVPATQHCNGRSKVKQITYTLHVEWLLGQTVEHVEFPYRASQFHSGFLYMR